MQTFKSVLELMSLLDQFNPKLLPMLSVLIVNIALGVVNIDPFLRDLKRNHANDRQVPIRISQKSVVNKHRAVSPAWRKLVDRDPQQSHPRLTQQLVDGGTTVRRPQLVMGKPWKHDCAQCGLKVNYLVFCHLNFHAKCAGELEG